MNIAMPRLFWRDWQWSVGHPLQQYDSRKLYSILHQHHELAPILNACWVASDPEDRWICCLHSVWSVRFSYNLRVFVWLFVYQGLPFKAKLAKNSLSDGLLSYSFFSFDSMYFLIFSFCNGCLLRQYPSLSSIHIHGPSFFFLKPVRFLQFYSNFIAIQLILMSSHVYSYIFMKASFKFSDQKLNKTYLLG